MAIGAYGTGGKEVSVAQEDGEGIGGFDSDRGEDCHVVRAVWIVGDSSESHGLTLSAIHSTALVQSTQLSILLGNNLDFGHNRSRFAGSNGRQ